jgi:Uma2 family endonuclease
MEAFSIEPDRVRPLLRSEYDRMVQLGLFHDERIELIQGVLIKKMSPQGAPHASTVHKLARILTTQLAARAEVRTQLPLALSDVSEPEPDVAITPPGDYDAEHPTTALLIIEVADSSLKVDRVKCAIYASAGIPEYWIVNLGARTVEVYTSPDGDRYGEVRTLHTADVLRPRAFDDLAIAIADILPRA